MCCIDRLTFKQLSETAWSRFRSLIEGGWISSVPTLNKASIVGCSGHLGFLSRGCEVPPTFRVQGVPVETPDLGVLVIPSSELHRDVLKSVLLKPGMDRPNGGGGEEVKEEEEEEGM
ncbi:unnamed protein product [Pleuronectes platessa]|uniref:Uncharacterized protein n=1 Tax=Pleuronectes platessa TaxID=8262 RepID=A0A9N7ZCS3_PLEPL|nr:unnamed protein product [Pleuronectes platessa]